MTGIGGVEMGAQAARSRALAVLRIPQQGAGRRPVARCGRRDPARGRLHRAPRGRGLGHGPLGGVGARASRTGGRRRSRPRRRPLPARRDPDGHDRRGVGAGPLPDGARPGRPARRPRPLRVASAHAGLRQLAGGPHPPRPTARRPWRNTTTWPASADQPTAGPPPRPCSSSARPSCGGCAWANCVPSSPRSSPVRALGAPGHSRGPPLHAGAWTPRWRWPRRTGAVRCPGRRARGSAGWPRLLLRSCRVHAAQMERGVATAAAERAQAVDYGLRIVAQEQVGLAYAGWDRLLTRVALPAWRMGRWPSRLDVGVVAALTELSRRDRLAEATPPRLGERPACDLLEEPGVMDEAVSLLAARLFHGGPAGDRPGLGAGGLGRVSRGGRRPDLAHGRGPPPPRPGHPGRPHARATRHRARTADPGPRPGPPLDNPPPRPPTAPPRRPETRQPRATRGGTRHRH